jgi:hypothetical protein
MSRTKRRSSINSEVLRQTTSYKRQHRYDWLREIEVK